MFQNGDVLTNWLFLGTAISGFLIIVAFFMKRSDGLFLARTSCWKQSYKIYLKICSTIFYCLFDTSYTKDS